VVGVGVIQAGARVEGGACEVSVLLNVTVTVVENTQVTWNLI